MNRTRLFPVITDKWHHKITIKLIYLYNNKIIWPLDHLEHAPVVKSTRSVPIFRNLLTGHWSVEIIRLERTIIINKTR